LNSDFGLIESGLLLNISTSTDFVKLLKRKFSKEDFSKHGAAFEFAVDYFNEYAKIPNNDLLTSKFEDINLEAKGLDLDYCIKEFTDQFLYRRTVLYINNISNGLGSDPSKAIRQLSEKLDDLSLRFLDDDVSIYDDGDDFRFIKYQETKALLNSGKLKIIGIPTPFKSFNRTRMGWQEGNLVSFFAKSTVGKSWIAAKQAAIASSYGFKTLLLSPEMTLDDTGYRLDVIHANMLGKRISHQALVRAQEIDETAYKEVLSRINSKKLLVSDSFKDKYISIEGIRAKVKEHRPNLLIIDGIELISSKGNQAAWEKMNDLIYAIKYLCLEQKIPGMITAQASIRVRNGHLLHVMPQIDQIAFGQTLFRASDVLLSMCKVKKYENMRRFTVQKSRNFDDPAIRQLVLDWDVDYGKIEEKMEPDWEDILDIED